MGWRDGVAKNILYALWCGGASWNNTFTPHLPLLLNLHKDRSKLPKRPSIPTDTGHDEKDAEDSGAFLGECDISISVATSITEYRQH
jgi:hypothetical protein